MYALLFWRRMGSDNREFLRKLVEAMYEELKSDIKKLRR